MNAWTLGREYGSSQGALLILAAGNLAFTAHGTARVVEEPMEGAPDYAAVQIEVEGIDDHRQPEFAVESGAGRSWNDEHEQRALGVRVESLRSLTTAG